VENPVDYDVVVLHLEVEAVFLGAETIESAAVALDYAEAVAAELFQVLAGHLELVNEFQLVEGAQAGEFRSADFIEDDLQHASIL
jgi:hypothetical protein